MRREIIFRAKCYGTWRYGNYVHLIKKPSNNCCNCNHKDFIVSNEDDGEHYYPITDSSSVGQFTGLTDCKGKEIYEGDIIESGGFRHIVEYDAKQARFSSTNINSTRDGGSSITQQWIDECEKVVIGNIYDNSEKIE